MSRKSDPITAVRRVVVVFDICSSTMILEDLLRTENQRRWRNLLIGLKKELVCQAKRVPFELYKFVETAGSFCLRKAVFQVLPS
jgi:hypothetical protein